MDNRILLYQPIQSIPQLGQQNFGRLDPYAYMNNQYYGGLPAAQNNSLLGAFGLGNGQFPNNFGWGRPGNTVTLQQMNGFYQSRLSGHLNMQAPMYSNLTNDIPEGFTSIVPQGFSPLNPIPSWYYASLHNPPDAKTFAQLSPIHLMQMRNQHNDAQLGFMSNVMNDMHQMNATSQMPSSYGYPLGSYQLGQVPIHSGMPYQADPNQMQLQTLDMQFLSLISQMIMMQPPPIPQNMATNTVPLAPGQTLEGIANSAGMPPPYGWAGVYAMNRENVPDPFNIPPGTPITVPTGNSIPTDTAQTLGSVGTGPTAASNVSYGDIDPQRAETAIDLFAQNLGTSWKENYCLAAVKDAWGRTTGTGDSPMLFGGSASENLNSIRNSPNFHAYDGSIPPRGAAVFYPATDNNDGFGHVCISLGDGRVITTGWPGKPVSIMSIEEMSRMEGVSQPAGWVNPADNP